MTFFDLLTFNSDINFFIIANPPCRYYTTYFKNMSKYMVFYGYIYFL